MSDYHKGIARGLSMAKRVIDAHPGEGNVMTINTLNLLIEETELMAEETKPKVVYRKRGVAPDIK